MSDGNIANLIAGTITVVWAVSFVIDAVNPMYDPPASIGTLMMAVAGALFGGTAIAAIRNGRKNGGP